MCHKVAVQCVTYRAGSILIEEWEWELCNSEYVVSALCLCFFSAYRICLNLYCLVKLDLEVVF